MLGDPVYIWYRKAKERRPTGQILTLLVLAIIIMFLFIVITINIGKISGLQAYAKVGAQSAALSMASTLASIARTAKNDVAAAATHEFRWPSGLRAAGSHLSQSAVLAKPRGARLLAATRR